MSSTFRLQTTLLAILLWLSAAPVFAQSQPESAHDSQTQAERPSLAPEPKANATQSTRRSLSQGAEAWADSKIAELEQGKPLTRIITKVQNRAKQSASSSKILLFIALGLMVLGVLLFLLAFHSFRVAAETNDTAAGFRGFLFLTLSILMGVAAFAILISALVFSSSGS